MNETLTRLRYRIWPDHVVGELLAKRWMDTAIPALLLAVVVIGLSFAVPGMLAPGRLLETLRQAGEMGFVVLGLTLVMIVGGIDLSVGSIFALTNLLALYLIHVLGWSVAPTILVTLVAGGLLGAVNGILIGYLRLGAFLTTLITLIIYRSIYDILSLQHSAAIAASFPDSLTWELLGTGNIAGVPMQIVAFVLVAILAHIFLTRLRMGWHIMAIGGSRRSAHNSGVAVKRTIALCYVASGVMTAISGIFYASRLSSAGSDVGAGLEIMVVTAAILGGISLGGGKGSVTKAVIGTLIVLLLTNGLVRLGVSGGITRMVLASALVLGAIIDARWMKNRQKIIDKAYISPTYHRLPAIVSTAPESGTPYAENDALHTVEAIGLGRIEGPEDVILDRDDNLYAGTRHGEIVKFHAPDYTRMEVLAKIGGQTLGMAMDRNDDIYVCIGGMGLYRVTLDGKVEVATVETKRSWTRINDDSRMRLADDLDIALDGKVYFSEATTRYEMSETNVAAIEARACGRILCYDPSTGRTETVIDGLKFPNGICLGNDGQSILYAETWTSRITRYYFDGPKKGTSEVVIDNLPGYPDNINAASDGNYWLALVGMRSPAFDLAWRMPSFRRRMVLQLPADEWLFPNVNTGFVLKFNDKGEILATYWDRSGEHHPMITSMREHRGYLYLGGISNNRIGRIKLDGADPDYVQYDRRWGKQ